MAYKNKRYKPPSTSDLVRVMTDGPFQGTYHGRPAPGMLGPGVKQPGSHITQREIEKKMYRPVDGRDVADVYGGVIAYTPTEEEYRQREIDYLNSLKRLGLPPRPRLKLPPEFE